RGRMGRQRQLMDEFRTEKPIHPKSNVRRSLERAGGLAVLIGGTALKWGFIFVKFFGFFISVAAYTLWFHSWTFALGFVLMLVVLANIAFLLNAFNMLPIGFLDGGQTIRAAREAWRMPVIRFEGGVPVQAFAPDRTRALTIVALYVGLAALLVLGMLATRPNG